MFEGMSAREVLLFLFYQEMEKCDNLKAVESKLGIKNLIIKATNFLCSGDYLFYLANKETIDAIINKLLHQFNSTNFEILLNDDTDPEKSYITYIIQKASFDEQKYLIFEPVILEFSKKINQSTKNKQKMISM